MPVVAINSASQILTGRLHVLRRTSRTQLPKEARNYIGMAAETERGPLTPQVISSPKRFEAVYGKRNAGQNKGWLSLQEKELFPLVVCRSAAAAATASYLSLSNVTPTVIARATASSVGVWSVTGTLAVTDASNGDANYWKATWVDPNGSTWIWDNLLTTAGNNNLAQVQGGDAACPITLTKIADGRPLNSAAAVLNTVVGSEGSIADTDFTAAGKSMSLLNVYAGIKACFVAERSSVAAIKAKATTLAAATSDRRWGICTAASTTAMSAAVTDRATYPGERIIYLSGAWPTIVNPDTGLSETVEPVSFRMALISQTAPHIHAADSDNAPLLSGIRALSQAFTTEPAGGGDLDLAAANGITSLYTDATGIKFFNDATNSLASGAERSSTAIAIDDQLLSEAAVVLAPYLNKPWSVENELAAASDVEAVGERSFKAGTGVSYWVNDDGTADRTRAGQTVDTESVNDNTTRANNEFHCLWRYRRMGHMNAIVLEHEAGRGLTFRRLANAA
jgi:hypothetical protein